MTIGELKEYIKDLSDDIVCLAKVDNPHDEQRYCGEHIGYGKELVNMESPEIYVRNGQEIVVFGVY